MHKHTCPKCHKEYEHVHDAPGFVHNDPREPHGHGDYLPCMPCLMVPADWRPKHRPWRHTEK